MAERKPKFREDMLSESSTLSELGITEDSAQLPDGWQRAEPTAEDINAEQELLELFSQKRLKRALRTALRKVAGNAR